MNLLKPIWNLLFPPRCPFCGTIQEEEGICPQCQQDLPWIKGAVLPARGDYFQRCYAPLWYRGVVRPSFHNFKFNGRRRYHKIYGQLMAQAVEDHLIPRPDCITWAPLSPSRRRRRGYDQSQLLAQMVAKELGIPLCSTLEKWRNTPPQSSLEGETEKKQNAEGAYRLAKDAQVAGKSVLLVDDIFTTGSTLSQCAKVLCEGGATHLVCVALARADIAT